MNNFFKALKLYNIYVINHSWMIYNISNLLNIYTVLKMSTQPARVNNFPKGIIFKTDITHGSYKQIKTIQKL